MMANSILPPYHHTHIDELDDPGFRPPTRPPSMRPTSRSILPSALACVTFGTYRALPKN
jgi:hypothetical protein